MSEAEVCQGQEWWNSLTSYKKIAVIRHCSEVLYLNNRKTQEFLGLKSVNVAVNIKSQIHALQKAKKDLPPATSPLDVVELIEPKGWSIVAYKSNKNKENKQALLRGAQATNAQSSRRSLKIAPRTMCCDSQCESQAVPQLPFCVEHCKKFYRPMPEHIKRIVDAFLQASPKN